MRIASFFEMFVGMVALVSAPVLAVDRVAGANASLDIEPGARSAALGSATMAIDGDYLGLVSNPYQLSNVRYMWASFSHTEYFEDTRYDYASVTLPLGLDQGLGISFARFGADDIPLIREGDALPGAEAEPASHYPEKDVLITNAAVYHDWGWSPYRHSRFELPSFFSSLLGDSGVAGAF